MKPAHKAVQNRAGGVTLIEVAVALAVSGLVALAIFGLFRIGVAFHRRSVQTVGGGEGALALEAIARPFRESGRAEGSFHGWSSAPVGSGYDTVAFRAARSHAGFLLREEGQPQWVGWIGFAYDPVRKAVLRFDFPETQRPPVPPWAGGRILIRQARDFSIQREGDRFVVTLVLASETDSLALATTVWPRNR